MIFFHNVFGYVDPGLGTFIMQFLLATIAGLFFYFRSFFLKIFSFLFLKKRKKD
jgi:hypothetical protein